jgi:hypothetical protein
MFAFYSPSFTMPHGQAQSPKSPEKVRAAQILAGLDRSLFQAAVKTGERIVRVNSVSVNWSAVSYCAWLRKSVESFPVPARPTIFPQFLLSTDALAAGRTRPETKNAAIVTDGDAETRSQ